MEDMLVVVSIFRRDIERGLPNAQKLLDDYTEEKKLRVELIKEVCYPIFHEFRLFDETLQKFSLWNDWHTNEQLAKRLAWYEIPTFP